MGGSGQGGAGLSRDRIVREAVRLADRNGIEGLSMRKLAEQLHAAPMALYRHVANKEDLLDGMVDVLYGEVETPQGIGWKAALRQRATAMRATLLRHPWAVGVMESRSPGPANLRYHNAGIACLRGEAGLPIRTAIDAYNLMDSYLYGFALQEKTLPGNIAAEAEARRETLSRTNPSLATTYPYLIEVVEELGASGYDYTEQFERGLEHILNAIDQLRP
jgi:AcrR family transcriptional regulator